MSVLGPSLLVVAGMGALLAITRVAILVAHDARDEQVGRALTTHGACWLAFVLVAVLLDPLSLPAVIEVAVAIMAAAWGAAWIVIGRAYGFVAASDGRVAGWAQRSAGAASPRRRSSSARHSGSPAPGATKSSGSSSGSARER